MTFLQQFVHQTWSMIAEMGAFLLLGFALSVALHRYLKQAWIERIMGRKGLRSIVWGSVVGVPMPLCSCGVIPVTMSLRDKGASKGATVSFLTSTPQTGVDSMLATYGMLGPVFALYKVAVAFVSGILIGLVVELFPAAEKRFAAVASPPSSLMRPAAAGLLNRKRPKAQPTMSQALRYGFITMPGDLANALLIGFALAGLIAALAPENLLANIPGGELSAILLATLISVPLYICSTGSIPLALALIHAGLPIGAALVLLIAGPATNIATIAATRKVLGGRVAAIYVAGVILCSWIAAAIFQFFIADNLTGDHAMGHAMELPLWKHIGGAALLALLLLPKALALLPKRARSESEATKRPASMKTATITIDGMNCSHCESSITNGLAELPGTERVVSVDRASRSAVIQGSAFDEGAIRQKIESLGFSFKGLRLN